MRAYHLHIGFQTRFSEQEHCSSSRGMSRDRCCRGGNQSISASECEVAKITSSEGGQVQGELLCLCGRFCSNADLPLEEGGKGRGAAEL